MLKFGGLLWRKVNMTGQGMPEGALPAAWLRLLHPKCLAVAGGGDVAKGCLKQLFGYPGPAACAGWRSAWPVQVAAAAFLNLQLHLEQQCVLKLDS